MSMLTFNKKYGKKVNEYEIWHKLDDVNNIYIGMKKETLIITKDYSNLTFVSKLTKNDKSMTLIQVYDDMIMKLSKFEDTFILSIGSEKTGSYFSVIIDYIKMFSIETSKKIYNVLNRLQILKENFDNMEIQTFK